MVLTIFILVALSLALVGTGWVAVLSVRLRANMLVGMTIYMAFLSAMLFYGFQREVGHLGAWISIWIPICLYLGFLAAKRSSYHRPPPQT